jgi:hypothetical protein
VRGTGQNRQQPPAKAASRSRSRRPPHRPLAGPLPRRRQTPLRHIAI